MSAQDTQPIPGLLTWQRLLLLLDAGLSPRQIDRLCFLRWAQANAEAASTASANAT